MKYVIILAALGLTAAASLVFAEGPGAHRGPMLERLKAADTNGDGMVSRAESAALPTIAKHFDAIDANGDGQITFDELRAFHEKQRAERWKRIDSDGDGRVSREEAKANAPRLAERFDRLDLNGDGFLTPDELRAAHTHRAAK